MAIHFKISAQSLFGAAIFLIIFANLTKSFGQDDPAGFLSIDCGSDKATATDLKTNLLWVSDDDYISTGSKGSVPSVDSTLDNYQALRTFRYFPNVDRRSKYCYELPITRTNITLLLRAMFLHGNASELEIPFTFDVYVNATLWTTVDYNENYNISQPFRQESLFFIPPKTTKTYVCLSPYEGVPFISSLEMRYLDPEGIMYSESFNHHMREQLFYSMLRRWNTGAKGGSASLRYPDDKYDRIWFAYSTRNLRNISSETSSLQTDSAIGPNMNAVPSKVLEDVWVYNNSIGTGVGSNLHWNLTDTGAGVLIYVIFYFALLNDTQQTQLPIAITLDSQSYPSFNISHKPAVKSFFHVLNAYYVSIRFSGPFILNAVEIYEQGSFIAPTTYPPDVEVINFFKTAFNMTDWQGDPCVPFPHDWIDCALDYYYPYWNVTFIELSQLQNSQKLDELGVGTPRINSLRTMSITHSNISSNTLSSLVERFFVASLHKIRALDFSNNDITTLDPTVWIDAAVFRNKSYGLTYLDLSYNQLNEVPSLAEFPFSGSLYVLNISNNKITGVFPSSTNFGNLSQLQTLNISNNYVEGPLPESLSSWNLPSLQVLDISNNRFSGEFNSSFYFLNRGREGQFQQLNASHNAFNGILDLTQWYQNLQDISKAGLSNTTVHNNFSQLFSFVNNKFTSINPDAEHFEPIINGLIHNPNFNRSGILLGGNPYCANAKLFTERYFCRSNVIDIVYAEEKGSNKKATIIGSVIGASVAFFGFLISSLIIWKLCNQVHNLRKIQRELTNRKVQPPYFSYRDLKAATRNFHHESNLGSGTFGVVYKGTLSDGTTVAVKRLFDAKQKKVLDEFLNEVVLITGIKHKNLVQLKGCCVENQERILVYEYAERGNIVDALWGKQAPGLMLSWKDRYNICIGVVRGLSYLHEELQPRIIHRDIKPANILLDQNLNPKIADFGTAKTFMATDEDDNTHFTENVAGTKGYFAPEYVTEGKLTTKADVYSFGVFVLEIVSGRRWSNPPHDEIHLKTWAKALQRTGNIMDLLDPALRSECHEDDEVIRVVSIALMCVRVDPEHRPTMSEVETMLLEGKERNYRDLSAALLQENSSSTSLNTIYERFGVGLGSSTTSTLSKAKLRTSADSTSSSTGWETQSENRPLLWPKQTSTTGKDYLQSSPSLTRSFSC